MYEGSCLCGSIRYSIASELSDFGYCHCTSCRKASGTAFAANAGLDRGALALEDPNSCLKEYESSPGKLRAFCSACGSPIFAYLTATPNLVRIRLGTLDTPLEKTAKAHTFVSEKAPWHVIGGDLPQFPAWADKDVLVQVGSRQN